MKVTIEIDDAHLDELAALIAGKLGSAKSVDEDDDFGTPAKEEKKELTLADVQEVVGAAVQKHGKDKVKAMVKKVAGADKVKTIPADKFQAVVDAAAKIK